MLDLDYHRTWYHGSPAVLVSLVLGSTITQDEDLAMVFSHKPAVVSQWEDTSGKKRLKHTGKQPGYLYRIAEDVLPEDVCPHPRTAMEPGQEWLTCRELRVELIRPTEIVVGELLSDDDFEELKLRGRY